MTKVVPARNAPSSEVAEKRSLEYKQQLPERNDKATKEFLADVSSFANAGGGTIVWGVAEERDANNRPTGLPGSALGLERAGLDAEVLRLENVLRDSVKPRMSGVKFDIVERDDKRAYLVTHVRRSWNAPHMVAHGGSSRFYSRNSAGKYQLDVTELRSAFVESESVASRIARFRDERLGKLVARETPVPLLNEGLAVLHVFPLDALTPGYAIDLGRAFDVVPRPSSTRSWSDRFNFDGLLTFAGPPKQNGAMAYVQVFRNGAFESLRSSVIHTTAEGASSKTLLCDTIERHLVDSLNTAFLFYRSMGIGGPLATMPFT